MIAEIIIDSKAKSLNRKFDYEIPQDLEDIVDVGSRVLVPFGNFKTLEQGYIIKIKERTEYKVKPIAGLEENLPPEKIKLARWMARKYFCNVSECIKLMLTPGTRAKNKDDRVQDKNINFVYLNIPYEEINVNELKGEKQKKLVEFIKNNEGLTIPEIENFAEISRSTVNSLVKKEILKIVNKKIDRNPLVNKKVNDNKKLEFTDEQKQAYLKVSQAMEENRFEEFLLYGITGSGKTEVYLQLIEKALNENKSSICLVPEISLTPQMLDRFIGRFGKEKIAVLHSKLSIGERHDEWERIKKDEAKIVIGARSAIFAPCNNLGLIIIDEEHDSSYKSESSPRYSAKEVAREIAKEQKIPLILGSATPDLKTFYRAQNQEISTLRLTKRANNSNLPEVQVVDLKMELATGNRSMISNLLYSEMEKNLKEKRQTILFLNRRGYSSFVSCRECGYVFKCKHCDISLTYHKKQNIGKCHYCGYEEVIPQKCPECESKYVKAFGLGTEKIEEEIKQIFEGVRVLRLDKDTTSQKHELENILNKFQNREADILIGTQMISKGLDFNHVTLVGILSADMMLNFPDFKSFENTFQLVTQVSGRAGRSEKEGKVILQTYDSQSSVIKRIVDYDFEGFYEDEIKIRKLFNYTPFNNMLSVVISGKNELMVKKNITTLYNNIVYLLKERGIQDFEFILGPNPCSISKINSNYRWQILFKDDNIEINLLKGIIKYICITKRDVVFDKEVNISIDINPNSIL